ncbi:protein kinase [Lujinxingia vulgaris]|uniref:Protein kinase n=1 Tax=Lujinxingia vulgaris TaxID=2600176 RepID=A0A5C6X709_9DELT|nr:protein kinase [Lujinxingia vulgaris]TXD35479.1 protein kinase [Lujinxingia vulgaris]
MAISLADFTLNRPLGRGGMGEVWHATHNPTATEVAIKIITSKRATDPHFLKSFHHEVRSVARLSHPGIIRVFDTATVTAAEAAQAPSLLTPESPYLVMELAAGSLREISGHALNFAQQRAILLAILDALAHAHARGVIHRDLKPENVLMVHGPDGPTLKLSDFGLAHALDDHPDASQNTRVAGTPRFMAPEQILARLRDQGPWTDLYALGCLAFWLASGSPPYSGATTEDILHAHLHLPLPPLETDADLPAPFGAWIGRLLAKHHADRYQFAADAAFDLQRLSAPTPAPPLPELPTPALRPPTATPDEPTELEATLTALLDDASLDPPATLSRAPLDTSHTHAHGPLFPLTWESPRDRVALRPDHLRGTGLGLFGLRPIPLVDRIPARDALWRALREVHATSTPRALVLSGPSGVGKTRQATWLCQRAHERGVAFDLHAPHSPIASRLQGLPALLNELFRSHNLSHDARIERVRDTLGRSGPLGPDELADCIELASLSDPGLLPRNHPSAQGSPRQRYALIARALKRIFPHRPVVLHLDDVHYGLDTLRFALFLLDLPEELAPPTLIIATSRDDLVATRPDEALLLERLKAHARSTDLPVEPLAEDDHRTLVQHLLGLNSELIEELVERTRGNPLFAVQLVGDWVARDILTPSAEGFHLRPGEQAPLPESIDALLRDRVSLLIAAMGAAHERDALFALEIAAALGQDIDPDEWHAACVDAAVTIPRDLLERLTLARLAEATPDRWRFLHGALRESLQRLASEHDRWAAHNLHCARALRATYPEITPELDARIGRHLLAAGDHTAALAPLLRAAEHNRLTSDFASALQLFDLAEDALSHLPTPDDAIFLRLTTGRARTLAKQGNTDRAQTLVDALPSHPDPRLDAQRLFTAGIIARTRGEVRTGLALATACLERLEPLATPDAPPEVAQDFAKALQLFADLNYSRGHLDQAADAYHRSLPWARRANAPSDQASTWLGLAAVALAGERPHDALTPSRTARQLYEETQNLHGVAQCDNALGEIYRLLHQPREALHFYQLAIDTLQRIGVSQTGSIRFNIGMCLAAQLDFPAARPHFEHALNAMEAANVSGYLGVAHLALAACAAHTPDLDAFDHHLQRASLALVSSGMVNLDTATLAELATDQCLRHHDPQRARAVASIALDQLERLGLDARAEALRARLPPA